MGGIHETQTLLLILLILVAVFAVVAQRLKTPYPIVLVIVGLLLSLVPHIPRVPLGPDVVFLLFLPPLLYAAAWQTSWREFQHNLVSIAMLAFGLVTFTVFGVALVAGHFFPQLDFQSGFVLGAVVATTDAIAAAAIASRMHLPTRMMAILNGESLLNDATGLLALEFGIRMLQTGETPTLGAGLLRLLWLTVGGIAVGLALGALVAVLERWVEHGPIEMVISLVVPYTAYLAGEKMHASGVLAVVACGLYLSRRSVTLFSPAARIQLVSGWQSLDFVMNGLVFLLMGLQLPYVLAGIRGYGWWSLVRNGAVFSLMLVGLRLLWMFPAAQLASLLRARLLGHQEVAPRPREVFLVGWTGMRGVVALAAAFSLPETLENGRPFAQRDLIVFLTYVVILVTLVLQGLSLPWLIRVLGVVGGEDALVEERGARQVVLEQAIRYLEQERGRRGEAGAHAVEALLHRYQHRLEMCFSDGPEALAASSGMLFEELEQEAVRAERRAAVALRDQGRIGDEVLNRLLKELDFLEARSAPSE